MLRSSARLPERLAGLPAPGSSGVRTMGVGAVSQAAIAGLFHVLHLPGYSPENTFTLPPPAHPGPWQGLQDFCQAPGRLGYAIQAARPWRTTLPRAYCFRLGAAASYGSGPSAAGGRTVLEFPPGGRNMLFESTGWPPREPRGAVVPVRRMRRWPAPDVKVRRSPAAGLRSLAPPSGRVNHTCCRWPESGRQA